MTYEDYIADVKTDIEQVIKSCGCQPILFVGSGFSRRYFGAANWTELLEGLIKECPEINKELAYYTQSKLTYPEIGTIIGNSYKEWAWGAGRNRFPKEYFSEEFGEDIFLKYAVANVFSGIGIEDNADGWQGSEIRSFKSINPHAIITTNYDTVLEQIFPDYTSIIGQQVIRGAQAFVGEIFKIHGCLSIPESIVLTAEDYKEFSEDKKYLTAKMFTFFAEHPLLFVGYSASDENIRSILFEVNRILCGDSAASVDNIFILEWAEQVDDDEYPARDRLIDIGAGDSMRVKSIKAKDFSWVFDAFGTKSALEKVNVKLLRSLSHRVLDLVRSNVAKNTFEVDFNVLTRAMNDPSELAKVYGIAGAADPSLLNATHPFLPSEAAAKIEPGCSWQVMYKIMDQLKSATGFGMRETDNKMHVYIKPTRRFSESAIVLLRKFHNGEDISELLDPEITGVQHHN